MGLTHCTAENMRELPCRGTLDVCTWQNSPCDPGDDVWTRGVGVRSVQHQECEQDEHHDGHRGHGMMVP